MLPLSSFPTLSCFLLFHFHFFLYFGKDFVLASKTLKEGIRHYPQAVLVNFISTSSESTHLMMLWITIAQLFASKHLLAEKFVVFNLGKDEVENSIFGSFLNDLGLIYK